MRPACELRPTLAGRSTAAAVAPASGSGVVAASLPAGPPVVWLTHSSSSSLSSAADALCCQPPPLLHCHPERVCAEPACAAAALATAAAIAAPHGMCAHACNTVRPHICSAEGLRWATLVQQVVGESCSSDRDRSMRGEEAAGAHKVSEDFWSAPELSIYSKAMAEVSTTNC